MHESRRVLGRAWATGETAGESPAPIVRIGVEKLAKQLVHTEIRKLVKDIQKLGYTVVRDNGGHQKVVTPDGKFVYSLPNSPGRGRWRMNLISELKKRGVDLGR